MEFSYLESCQNNDEEIFFNREKTLALINLYKTYKPKVGKTLKSIKLMWEIIARDISNLFKITIAASKCENKFKVLERNYKKVTDNNNKTGRGRKTFEFELEFDDIYGKSRVIRPLTLLNSETIQKKSCDNQFFSNEIQITIPETVTQTVNTTQELIPQEITPAQAQPEPAQLTPAQKRKRRNANRDGPFYKKRNDILIDIKNDMRGYYREKIEIEREKLSLKKKSVEECARRTDILERLARQTNENVDENLEESENC